LSGTTPDRKEEIRRRIDIASFIGEYVALKKAGRNLLGLCPFHREKTPSFTVSPEKQMFYCYGCGEGGDVFSFLMKLNQLTFPETLQELAKRAGVVLPQKTLTPEERQQGALRERIRQANELAAGFYAGLLQAPVGEQARAYLRKRGIAPEAIQTFRLGYAPDEWQRLAHFLEKKRIPSQVAEAAGLLIPREGDRGHYDRFRGRLMIPIEDVDGRVIAFGGRIIGSGEPKYLNSPESPLYIKGHHLYGLSRTKEAIRERGSAILVEGYFDLISLWNAGIANAVAPLGTSLTGSQVDLLRRYTVEVSALFDADAAGRKALARSLELFLTGNVRGRAVILPEGQDPDDFVRTQGREKLETLIARSLSMADYYIERILGARGTLEEERDKLREAKAFLGRIEDPVERSLFANKVAEALGVDAGILKREVGRSHARPVSTPPPHPMAAGAGLEMDPLELSLIRMVLDHPDKIAVLREADTLSHFRTEALKFLGDAMLAADQEGKGNWDVVSFLNGLSGSLREKLLALRIEESPYPKELIDRLMADTIAKIRERSRKEREQLLTRQIKEAERAKDPAAYEKLIAEKNRLLKKKGPA